MAKLKFLCRGCRKSWRAKTDGNNRGTLTCLVVCKTCRSVEAEESFDLICKSMPDLSRIEIEAILPSVMSSFKIWIDDIQSDEPVSPPLTTSLFADYFKNPNPRDRRGKN